MDNKAKGASFGALFSVASVWFGSHAGGGFATGNQTTQYYVQYGWMASFLPMIAMGILALVLKEAMTMATTRNMYTYKEVFTELFGKAAEIQLIDLIFQEPGSLHGREVRRLFLIDEANTAEAVAAGLGRIEDTGAGAELSELPVFLEHEEVVLKLS